ncbi:MULTISPECIES: heavy-metal-associated domain-containing protein [unclassified Streptomyces]|jgi:copper ion binding protein|uniref:heavy-metal-associated domain-containing protein n=1 Tax=unclassified Streptomyces TaxID=2593676 RepID=UPI0027808E25|nr:cation transporter [Streptomyces sp. V1I6]MDQ0841023.1 copper ion binding protein [Streptomyces sp. V1I6]
MVKEVYEVKGMTCGHCVSAVTAEVGALAGVESVQVDLSSGEVTVESERQVAYDDVAAAVDEAGYELTGRRER